MVVILLLTPPYTQSDGCDGGTGSNGSSTSTGDTAIPAYIYQQHQQQQPHKHEDNYDEEPTLQYYFYPNSSQYQNGNRYTTTAYNGRCYCQCCQPQQQPEQEPQAPPPLPKTQPTNKTHFEWTAHAVGGQSHVLPAKPPRLQSDKSFLCAKDQWSNAADHSDRATYTQQQQPAPEKNDLPEEQVDNEHLSSAFCPPANIIRPMPQRFQAYFTNNNNNYKKHKKNKIHTNNNTNTNTNTNRNTSTSYYVRHVTRVNFYDVDTSQIEFESKDSNNDDNEQQLDTEAITKEGEL